MDIQVREAANSHFSLVIIQIQGLALRIAAESGDDQPMWGFANTWAQDSNLSIVLDCDSYADSLGSSP